MALTRPTLLNTRPFDATQAHVFSFQSSGGSSNITANRLIIKRNDTLAEVYNQQQTTFSYSHNLPANTLQNGIAYQATITTYGADGSESVASVPIIFYCLATPTFEFTNIPSGNTITSNSFSFDLLYNQANGEQLNSATFNLYSVSGALLSTSGAINDFDNIPTTISYLFSGFENNTEYYIEAVGETVKGMIVSTAQINLFVNYSEVQTFSTLTLTNNCRGGYITVQSSVISIDGQGYGDYQFVDDGIDLTSKGSSVEFNDGYNLSGDFTAKIWGYKFILNSRIVQFSTLDGNIITVEYKTDSDNGTLGNFILGTNRLGVIDNAEVYLELTVNSYRIKYCANSATIPQPSDDEQVYIMLRRIGGIYQIDIVNRGAIA